MNRLPRYKSRFPRAALVTLYGFGLAVNAASALELGNITVHSALGQPLRASIVYALGPNETMQSHCISLRPAGSGSDIGLPTIRNATAIAGNGVIRLTGSVPIREPMLNLNLVVDCPGTVSLNRSYTILVDASPVVQDTAPATARTPVRSGNEPAAPAPPAVRPEPAGALPAASQDTAPAPTVGTEPPDVTGNAAPVDRETTEVTRATVDSNDRAPDHREATTSPRPGDVSVGPDSALLPAVEQGSGIAGSDAVSDPARDAIPETGADAAAARPPAPQVVVRREVDNESLGSLAWLGGGGIAIILGLLLIGRRLAGRRLADRFGSPGERPSAGAARGRRGNPADEPQPAARLASDDAVDGESPVHMRRTPLDADLDSGMGFDDDSDIQVAQEFGFSTSRDLYGSLDAGPSGEAGHEPASTEIRATQRLDHNRFTDTLIVEEEIPPRDDTGEYDLSMIVDATRQPDEEEGHSSGFAMDLQAIQVEAEDGEAPDPESMTLTREVDYMILEQDYEDELTATQVLNEQLIREGALVEQLERLDATTRAEATEAVYAAVDEELTRQLPDLGEFERVAEMGEEMNEDGRVDTKLTVKLPAGNDDPVEMDIESATADTKKLQAS